MHPKLEKLIDLVLVDGNLSEDKRAIIFKKANELGVEISEVEKIIAEKTKQIIPNQDAVSQVSVEEKDFTENPNTQKILIEDNKAIANNYNASNQQSSQNNNIANDILHVKQIPKLKSNINFLFFNKFNLNLLTILISISIIILSIAYFIFFNESKSDEYFAILERGKIRIGVQSDAPPLNYYDKNNRPKGLDYSISKLIFLQPEFNLQPNDISIIHEVQSYDEILPLLKNKENDEYTFDIVMGGLSYGDGDEKGIIFTDAYLDNMGYSLISGNNDNINTIDDLIGKKVGIIQGDPDVKEYVEQLVGKNSHIIELSDEEDEWMQINFNNKIVDAFIYDFPFATTELSNTPKCNLEIKLAKLPDSNLEYKIGLREGNEELRKKLNLVIGRIKESQEYADQLKIYLPTKNVSKIKNTKNLPMHKVKYGESLSIISQNELGNMNRWIEIQNINNIPNPHLINVGDNLMIPSFKKSVSSEYNQTNTQQIK